MRNRLRLWLRRRGFEIGRFNPDSSAGAYLAMSLEAHGVNCVLDVGASLGEFGQKLRRNGYTGQIVSFEPILGNYSTLSTRLDASWRAHQLALGAEDSEADIGVRPNAALGSFLVASEQGRRTFGGDIVSETRQRVMVARLDTILEEVTSHVPHLVPFLKLDVQGFEREVLRGAEGCLHRFNAVLVEAPFGPSIYAGSASFDELRGILTKQGFQLAGVWSVFRFGNGALAEADCLFVRGDCDGRILG